METEFTLPCNMSDDTTIFWYDDNHVFSRIVEMSDGKVWEETAGSRHDWQDVKAFRDWLNEVIAKEERTNG